MTTGRTVLEIRDMTFDIRSSECVFIEVGDKTFYVDDSTGESIMDWWYTSDEATSAYRLWYAGQYTHGDRRR